MTETPIPPVSPVDISVALDQERGVLFSGPPLDPEPDPNRASVSVSADGNITFFFGSEGATTLSARFSFPQSDVVFEGILVGPAEGSLRGTYRVWRVGDSGQAENTPLHVEVRSEHIVLTSTFESPATYTYFLLYRAQGKTFLCDPEITNDGEPPPADPSDDP